MRPLIVISLLTLAGCAGTPDQPQTAASVDPDAGKNWCQRNQGACWPLLPLVIPLWVADGLIKAAPQAAINTLSETNVYGSTVRTPSGTYDAWTTCSGAFCSSDVTKRK